MVMLKYTTRPLSDRSWMRPPTRRMTSKFTTTWTDTLEFLEAEVNWLRGKDVVIEVDVSETMIRNDGGLYARAKAASPAVVVAFQSKHGPLLYRSDQYAKGGWGSRMEDWQHNVRAVALTLEALRAVDRYGASRSGEQYRGYKALEDKSHTQSMTPEQAIELLARLSNMDIDEIRGDIHAIHAAFRTGARKVHPDNGGASTLMAELTQAYDIVRKGL